MAKLVSIIIPCYNVQDYIQECVTSAVNQTYKHTEIICVDNNSNDKTWEILIRLKQANPKIIIDKELSPGASAARNKGLEISKGEWIQFLDADDLLLPDKIAHQMMLVSEKPRCAFVAGSCIKQTVTGENTTHKPLIGEPLISLMAAKLGNTVANLWNKKYVIEAGAWNTNQGSSQEAELMFRMLKKNNNIIFDLQPLAIIRERIEGQITTKTPVQNWQRFLRLRLDIFEHLKKEAPDIYIERQTFIDNLILSLLK
ncbi:MAG: glycosyltransferase family 2 protein, partial [Crenarchaeota archaeon]|nr:glycosyltransferase family 2 protein [Thermoproteota archaeon]